MGIATSRFQATANGLEGGNWFLGNRGGDRNGEMEGRREQGREWVEETKIPKGHGLLQNAKCFLQSRTIFNRYMKGTNYFDSRSHAQRDLIQLNQGLNPRPPV